MGYGNVAIARWLGTSGITVHGKSPGGVSLEAGLAVIAVVSGDGRQRGIR